MRLHASRHGLDPEECRLLLPVFYLDAFEQSWSCNKSVIGIYMAMANMPVAEYRKADLRILLCLVLKTISLHTAIREIIIKPMCLLKRGVNFMFKAEGKSRQCYGSAYAILGDHPSQMEMEGSSQ
jgi:hypothetical protein